MLAVAARRRTCRADSRYWTALAFFYVAVGVLNGQGRPTCVAIAFVIGGWGITVPGAYILAFPLHAVCRRLHWQRTAHTSCSRRVRRRV